ncbi:MAG: hypothetical protein LC793_04500 [Thermomicrobia bacterium]|nr:hypothetical protein [Thermomicrobia bacterium]MCA1724650.1 hypothetical protein [Thermomicrobia bacterium]
MTAIKHETVHPQEFQAGTAADTISVAILNELKAIHDHFDHEEKKQAEAAPVKEEPKPAPKPEPLPEPVKAQLLKLDPPRKSVSHK